MEYRSFGQTGMRVSAIGLGGLLARYEGVCGRPSAEERVQIYRRAAELGINLFDTGYGDQVHIPDELKGNTDQRYFCLKLGAPKQDMESVIDRHLANLRRDAIDILRVHHTNYAGSPELRAQIAALKQSGKVRALCLIRHLEADQQAYVAVGPEPDADADLVIYNYVCRGQESGLQQSLTAGKGVLIMKALGGQWLDWEQQTRADWARVDQEKVVELAPKGEGLQPHLPLIYPIVAGPWQELAGPGEAFPPPGKAVSWVMQNPAVSSVLVAFASVAELDETLGSL
jgi:aryl-alcohol dehydrogenase-like predicted oxidoreductase